ncbi:MAG: hypothetical protein HY457_02160 [Parcubacteria group bacterium]|nr:hypothetical protein [Parcubacteria group bacterium]
MDSEDRKMLQKIQKTVEENNAILRDMRSSMRWGRFFRIIYWLVIIGASVGALYFLQPYIEQMQEAYGLLRSGVGGIQDIGQKLPDLQGLLQR